MLPILQTVERHRPKERLLPGGDNVKTKRCRYVEDRIRNKKGGGLFLSESRVNAWPIRVKKPMRIKRTATIY